MFFRFYTAIVFLILFISTQLWAMAELQSEYIQRLDKFTQNRADSGVYTHTKRIYSILGDETKVSNRKATTDEQRKRILLPILASRMIHEQIEMTSVSHSEAGQKRISSFTYNERSAKAGHFKVIKIADELSRKLAVNFKIYGYGNILKDTDEKFAELERYSSVTASLFMDCFYEALEHHYDEFSYFDRQSLGMPTLSTPKIDRMWFADVKQYYEMGSFKEHHHKTKERETDYLFIRRAPDMIPFAVYKPVIPTVRTDPEGTTRSITSECLSSLFAKAAVLDDVVNRVIPVSVQGNTLIFDPIMPTGTIERYLGFSEDQIASDNTPFSRLIRNVCAFNGGSSTAAVTDSHAKSHLLNQKIFSRMFVHNYRAEDLQTFSSSRTINSEYLYKIIFFWYLSDYIDLHTSNIVLMPDFAKQQLIPMIIDTEMTWGQRSMVRNIPIIYQLHQAATALAPDQMNGILEAFDFNKLNRIIKIFPTIKNNFRAHNTLVPTKENLLLEKHFTAHFNTLMELRGQSLTIGRLLKYLLREPTGHLYTVPYHVEKNKFMTGLPWIYSVFDEADLERPYTISDPSDSPESQNTKKISEWLLLVINKNII